MFQEFVNRPGTDVKGLSWPLKFAANRVAMAGRRFPPLFFLFVLGGEDPIDHVQRDLLRSKDTHPLLERIMRIHFTEEARHLQMARSDEARWELADSVGKVQKLAVELGIAPRWIRPLWRVLQIWEGSPARA